MNIYIYISGVQSAESIIKFVKEFHHPLVFDFSIVIVVSLFPSQPPFTTGGPPPPYGEEGVCIVQPIKPPLKALCS